MIKYNQTNCADYRLCWPVFCGNVSENRYQAALKKLALQLSGKVVGDVVKVNAR
jgi:hypothetical protein